MNFYIFRHGETFATKENIVYGGHILDAPILEEGEDAIKKLGEYLKGLPSDFNVSSEFLRCRQTVEIVEKISGKKFAYDGRLNELNEPFEHFFVRVKNFLDEIKSKNYESVIICTHGAVMAILEHLIVDGFASMENLSDYPNPGELLIIKDNKSQLKDFN